MLHALSLLRAGSRNGTFLSRFRACADPGFVVQKGLCSVHAAAAWASGFCVVNVKLTIALAVAARLLRSGAPDLSAGSCQIPAGTIGVEQIGFLRGEGGRSVLDPRVKRARINQGRAFSEPSLFVMGSPHPLLLLQNVEPDREADDQSLDDQLIERGDAEQAHTVV